MPASYTIDADQRLVITTCTGVLSLADVIAHQNRLRADPAFDPEFDQLLDFTQVTGDTLNSDDIRRSAAPHIFSSTSRRAFVTPESVGFGLARMFTTYREIYGGAEAMQVFTDKHRALAWLASARTPS